MGELKKATRDRSWSGIFGSLLATQGGGGFVPDLNEGDDTAFRVRGS